MLFFYVTKSYFFDKTCVTWRHQKGYFFFFQSGSFRRKFFHVYFSTGLLQNVTDIRSVIKDGILSSRYLKKAAQTKGTPRYK